MRDPLKKKEPRPRRTQQLEKRLRRTGIELNRVSARLFTLAHRHDQKLQRPHPDDFALAHTLRMIGAELDKLAENPKHQAEFKL